MHNLIVALTRPKESKIEASEPKSPKFYPLVPIYEILWIHARPKDKTVKALQKFIQLLAKYFLL